jgi:hypothetical protein
MEPGAKQSRAITRVRRSCRPGGMAFTTMHQLLSKRILAINANGLQQPAPHFAVVEKMMNRITLTLNERGSSVRE